MRLAPRLLVGVAGMVFLAIGWRLTTLDNAHPVTSVPKPLDAAALAALQNEAFAQSSTQPGFGPSVNIPVKVQSGETF